MAVIVAMMMVVIVVMAVMVIVTTILVAVIMAVFAVVRAALRGIAADRLHQSLEIAREAREAGRLLPAALVHVQPPVHLDLQAVPSRRGVGEGAHQFDGSVHRFRRPEMTQQSHHFEDVADRRRQPRQHDAPVPLVQPLLGSHQRPEPHARDVL